MIDTNVSIGSWPFRKLPGEDLDAVVAHLNRNGITQAWTGSLEGLFDRDVAGVNQRLAEACGKADRGLLLPFGTVNPTLPDWEDDLRRCGEIHKFRGIRLHPAFHGYDLKHSAIERLFMMAAERNLIVQIVATMEDERTQHPVFRVPAVDLVNLPKLLESVPALRLEVLNAFRKLSFDDAAKMAAGGQVWFEIAMLEGVDRLAALIEKVNPRQILFGSHFPLFYIESAALKLRETQVPGPLLTQIQIENATRLLIS